MRKDARRVAVILMLAIIIMVAAVSFSGGLSGFNSQGEVGVLWQSDAVCAPTADVAVLWRSNIVAPSLGDVAVLWRSSCSA